MNEELMIKVKVDTSSLTTTINKLKNEVSNVNKQIGTAASSSTASSATNEKLAKAMASVEKSVQNIKSGISGWDITGAIVGAKTLGTVFDKAKASVKDLGKTISNAFGGNLANTFSALNPFSKMYKEDIEWTGWKDALADAKINFGEFTGELGSSIKNFKQRINVDLKSIGSAKNLKQLGAGFKDLGFTIKDATIGSKGFASAMKAVGAVSAAVATVLSAVFLAALAAIAVAGVAAAFSVSKLGKETLQTAQRFNMSAQAFQEWSYVMEHTGSSVDDLKGFLETLASEQAAVVEGSADAAENFKRLGLSANQVASMGQQELFEETVRRIQNISDATQRSSIAYSIFGDEASRLMNVLNMNSAEMQELVNNYNLLGGAMSGELLDKSNSLQNSIANMKQAWQGISNTLAEVFIPIVQKVVNWLTKAFVVINLFFRSIFGLDLKPAADSADKAASSTGKYTGGLKSAKKAAEELKRVTMGFDELNIVSDPNKSSADASAGSSAANLGGMGDMSSLMPDTSDLNLDSIYAWFEKYKTLVKDITAWVLVLGGIIAIAFAFGTGNVILGIAGLAALGLGLAVGWGEGGTWDKLLTGIGNFCKAAVDWVVNAISAVGQWIAGIPGWIYEHILVPIGEFFVWLGTSIANAAVSAWNAIVNFIVSIPGWINSNIVQPVLNFFIGLWNGFKNGAIAAWDGIKSVFSAVGNWFNNNIIKPVGNFFSNMWNGFKTGAKNAWEGIKSVFSAVTGWFSDVFTKAWNGVKKVFSTGGKIFDGIKEGIADTFKTVVNGIIGGINKVIAVPFNAINGLLNKIRDVSVAGIEPFKGLIKYNALSVPQIPKLATGGLVTGSVLANIGEAGNELVLPLEQNTQWMDTLADKIAERNSSPSKIVLQVGEKELGWATINSINSITKQTGGLQLTL